MGLVSSFCSCVSAYLLWSDHPNVKQVFRVFEELKTTDSGVIMSFKNSILEEMTKRKFEKAINQSNISEVSGLIREGFPINSTINDEKLPPLHYAAKRGALKVIKVLVEEGGADINLFDDIEKWTPLIICSINGHDECVEYLIKKGAAIELVAESGMTAIDYAREGLNSENTEKEKKKFGKIVKLLEKQETKQKEI